MRFSASHGLFEFENSLIGLSAQPPQPLVEQRFHAFRDVVLAEEFARRTRGGADDVREVFHLLAHRILESHGVQFAGVPYGEQHRYDLV